MDSIPFRKGFRILKRKSRRACRSTGQSTDPCHGRLARSTSPTREQSHFSRSIGPGRPLLPVHAHAHRSTGRSTGLLHRLTGRSTGSTIWLLQCAISRSFNVRSLCYLPSPLSPLSHRLYKELQQTKCIISIKKAFSYKWTYHHFS